MAIQLRAIIIYHLDFNFEERIQNLQCTVFEP